MKRLLPATLGLTLVAALGAAGHGDQGGFFIRLYGDRRACEVGDTLHLLIVENSQATMSADQKSSQATATTVGPGVGGPLSLLGTLGFSGTTSSTASGSSTRAGNVTARMTVQVIEITDTGNLLVEGLRTVSVNHEKEIIRIRGEVRPKDVGSDNTVNSYDVANVQIDYAGSDPRKPGKKVGIITRLLNMLF